MNAPAPTSPESGLHEPTAIELAYQGLLESSHRLSEVCRESNPELWPATFLAALAHAQLSYLASWSQPALVIQGFANAWKSRLEEMDRAGVPATNPIN